MFFGVFIGLTVAYMAVGAEGSFQEGTFNTSMTWNVIMIIVGLVSAILGGLVCSKIAQSKKAVMWLAGLVLVLGILLAIPVLTTTVTPEMMVRAGDTPMMDAMSKAKQPMWVALLNPILGAVGAILGGKLDKKEYAA